MTTPINPAFQNTSKKESQHSGKDFADHLDSMFGTSKRQWQTGPHVEVHRISGQDGKRNFRKSFLSGYTPWTYREQFLLFALKERNIPYIQAVEGYSIRENYFESQDAGPDIKHWLDLPVTRDGIEFDHIFQDCAHWFSLARWSIKALQGINQEGCVHLDIKADNICLPCQLNNGKDKTRVLPDWENLRLIDFAFSIWESVSKLTSRTPLIIGKETANRYQSQQLLQAIEASSNKNMEKARKLDWRSDLYSLGYLLAGILDHLPTRVQTGAGGWTQSRLDTARTIVDELQGYDTHWQKNPNRIPSLQHPKFIKQLDAILAETDLQHNLQAPLEILFRKNWRPGWAGLHTPITQLAKRLREDTTENGTQEPIRNQLLGGLLIVTVGFWGGYHYYSNNPTQSLTENTSAVKQQEATRQSEAAIQAADKRTEEVAMKANLTHQKAELPGQLVLELRKASSDQFDSIARRILPSDTAEAKTVLLDSSEQLRKTWSTAGYGNTERQAALERLLWVINRLPAKEKTTEFESIAKRYAFDGAVPEASNWWKEKNVVSASVKERAWLNETEKLSTVGIPRAQYNEGMALLNGKKGPPDSGKAGKLFSQFLSNTASGKLGDIEIAKEVLQQTDAIALVGGDRSFSSAITPGLKALANTDNPAAIWQVVPAATWLLANIMTCRQSSPDFDETKRLLLNLSNIEATKWELSENDTVWKEVAKWKKVANRRLATINDPQWCDAYSRAQKK